jgi:plasmid stabilization system protein ParE
MRLRIDPAAEEETEQAAQWYEDRRVGLGTEFLAAIDACVQRIGRQPYIFGRLETLPEEENVRRCLVRRFPYAIIYEISGDEIWILAVAHTRRRPMYWKNRRPRGN